MPSRIDFPDTYLLEKIKKQNLYYDVKSKDPHLNKQKPKYKLAGNCLLKFYFFHILTTSKDACKKACTFSINLSDWKEVAAEFELKLKTCYCDLTKYEKLTSAILLKKIRDRNNGFHYVGKLSRNKYKKMQKLIKRMRKYPYISPETKNIIEAGFSPSVDDLLSKLKLD